MNSPIRQNRTRTCASLNTRLAHTNGVLFKLKYIKQGHEMHDRQFISKIMTGIWMMLAMTFVHAGTPLWTFTPLTPTTVALSEQDTATVSYQITNQSHTSHTLTMKAIPGVTQVSTSGNCPNPFVLGYKQSCVLMLSINGSALNGNIINGPVVCQQGNANQCYQPDSMNVLRITKSATTNTHTVGGTVSGLQGTVILQNNDSDALSINTDGTFTFSNSVAAGSPYSITVQTQPGSQICTVNNGSGTITNSNVTNVTVICSTNTRTVGGTLSGLGVSESVVLQNNGADNLTLSSNGSFTFSTPVAQGAGYSVTIVTQPITQTCVVTNGSGTAAGSNISNVTVTCTTNTYTVGGSVSGLQSTVILQNNGGDNLSLNANGAFTFSTLVASGNPYSVSVQTQPANQTCVVTNGSGTVSTANITNVTVTCTTNTRTVGGTLSGLGVSESVVLQNNSGDNLTLSSNGSFTFSTPVAQGTPYSVTILNQPTTQSCVVTNGSGTVGGSNITSVTVTCTTNNYTVSGSVFGLQGTVTLQNNGGDNLILGTDGIFIFSTSVASGTTYLVTVQAQPGTQTCTVSNASGTVTNANITNVTVNCSTNTRTVGGTLSGLTPSESVVLQNNGGDNLTLSSNGPFTFATSVAQGGGYNVTVLTQPTTQTCTVNNGSGTAGGSNITNVLVTCSTNTYTVGGSLSGLSGTVVLQNNGGDNLSLNADGTFNFTTPVAQGATYAVTVFTQPGGQFCVVTNGSGTMGGAPVTNVSVTCAVGTTLTTSGSTLALSVTGLTEYGVSGNPPSGAARIITIRNSGSDIALNLSVAPPTWPSGTTSSTNCGSTLAAGNSCTITVTPGDTATGDGTNPCSSNGTAPVPGIIQVTAGNASTVSANVVVLSYGCIYQDGFVYAFDDSTPTSGSVGGKVIATSNQADLYPNGVPWSSNGVGALEANVSYDLIPGISDASTTGVAVPSYAIGHSRFNSVYSNTGTHPFPASGSFSACDGGTDGACNSANILALYNMYNTHYGVGGFPYTLAPGPTPLSYYAAGLCYTLTDGGASNGEWYLPAICEMGPSFLDPINCGSTQNIADNLPNLMGVEDENIGILIEACAWGNAGLSSTNCLAGYYWSSTEYRDANSSINSAWMNYFNTVGNGGNYNGQNAKLGQLAVRCSRALTL